MSFVRFLFIYFSYLFSTFTDTSLLIDSGPLHIHNKTGLIFEIGHIVQLLALHAHILGI